MTQTYETAEAFSQAISTTLAPAAPSDQLRAALIAGIEEGEAQQRAPAAPDGGLNAAYNLRIADWVLRGQDIPVVEFIGIVAAAATAALGPAALVGAAVVTACSGFATLCWRTWRKGAPLSKPEIAVLGFITVHSPISQDDLLAKMHGTLGLSGTDITNAIATLQQTELRDGSIVSLIRKDAAGQWRPELN